jgi:membrane protease YdiL (CAAX protease family)
LWHLKNSKWQTKQETLKQVLYTTIIFGPLAAIVTVWTGTLWLAVIFHYAHNLIADYLRKKNL